MAALARERGIAAAVAPNGTLVDLTGDAPRLVEKVETGRVYLDGTELIGAHGRGGARADPHGDARALAVSVIIDERGRPIGGAWVTATGLPDNPKMRDGLEGALEARDRAGAGAGEAGGARRRRRAGGADPAGGGADLQRRGGEEAGVTVMISRLEA